MRLATSGRDLPAVRLCFAALQDRFIAVWAVVCLEDQQVTTTEQPASRVGHVVAGAVLDALLVYVEAMPGPCTFSRNPQIGLYYIAQHARDSGLRVKVDTLCSNDHVTERVSRILRETECSIVGFYVDQDNLWVLRRTVPALRQQHPDLKVVLGGPQATADPEGTLSRIPGALCAAIGEGEQTFLELLRLPELTVDACMTCSGLAVNTERGIALTPPRQPILDLDALSMPRRHELDIDFDPAVAPTLLSGRGCHGRCAFCFEGRERPREERRLRWRNLRHTLEEFDYLIRTYKSRYVCIVDDTFVSSPSRVREFCRALFDTYGGAVKWYCEARVDSLSRHADLLPLMVEAGCLRVQVGAESGSQVVLDAYRKGTTLDQMRYVVDSAAECGLLSLFGNFIVGGAFETRESWSASVEFALELLDRAPACAGFGTSIYTPYPGTPMSQSPADYGIEVIDQHSVMSVGDQRAACRTRDLSRFDVIGLRAEFDRRIQDQMRALLPTLPKECLLRHFTAHAQYGVQTEWYEVLSAIPAAHVYFSSIAKGVARPWCESATLEADSTYPIRTIEPTASVGDRFLVRNWHGAIAELDALASLLLELSAGKLSMREIHALLQKQYSSMPPDTLFDAIEDRFSELDSEGLVVWQCPR
jgi:anaerobic magnesium-protoporphyrin IX monomethyl ester cyclase